jgi:thiol-disulfide isomerase/thioredoxin
MDIAYSGDKAELNASFGRAINYFATMNSWFDDALSPDEFVTAVSSHLQTCRDSLAAYALREALPAEEVRLLESYIVGRVLDRATVWRDGEPQTETMRRLFTEVVDIHDSRYVSANFYGDNLLAYAVRCLANLSLIEDDPAAFITDFIQTVRNQPAGLARDIMVYSMFAEISFALPDVAAQFAPQAQTLLDSEYARKRFALLTAPVDALAIEPVPVEGVSFITSDFRQESLPKGDMLQHLAKKHPGKVIYIDVSAYWCGPCIADIPHIKKLEEAMAGEDVVFVTLWLESDFDATVALMRKHDLHGEHYFFQTDATRLFMSNYRLTAFPTYMLVDRSGKLVSNNAGRPSAEGTAGQIREFLR